MAAARSHHPARQLPAATAAGLAALVLLVLIYVGSRGLRDFDAALIGYAVGSVFALAAVVYRYTLWITRPPTWRYWKAGWVNFLSWRNFLRYTAMIPVAWWTDIFAQTFILKRSLLRWIMHMCIFWGVVLSCIVTFSLTFGWVHFTLVPPDHYLAWFFGPCHEGVFDPATGNPVAGPPQRRLEQIQLRQEGDTLYAVGHAP